MKLYQIAHYLAQAVNQPVILFNDVAIPLSKAKEYLFNVDKYPQVLPDGSVKPQDDNYSEFYR